MKRIILALYLLLVAFCSFAQKNAEPNLGAIKVEQSFSRFRHCMGDSKPELKRMELYIGDTKCDLKDSANYSGYFDINEFYDSVYQPSFALKMSLYAGNMRHNNDCEYRLDSTPGSHSSGEYERRSACGMRGAHEGYRTHTKYTIDDPIILVCNNVDMVGSLCIEEKQKINLQFNNFYTTNTTEAKLEYSIGQEGDNWKKIDIDVVPGGYVKIGYEDIFGEYTNENTDYLNKAGEILRIRAVKKLINGKWSSSEIISGIRFYPKGPDFEIEEIRRTACDDVKLKVKINNDKALNKAFLGIGKHYNWVIVGYVANEYEKEKSGNYRVKYKLNFENNNDGTYFLSFRNYENPAIEETEPFFLTEDNILLNKDQWLIIQFQVVGDNGVPISGVEFQKRWFQIPPRPTPVNFKQSEAYLFEKDKVKYHLGSTVNPYVVMEPYTVSETSENADETPYRFPYTFYSDSECKNEVCSITSECANEAISGDDEEAIINDINSNAGAKKEEFRKEFVQAWFNKNQYDLETWTFTEETLNGNTFFNCDNKDFIMADSPTNPEYIVYSHKAFQLLNLANASNNTVDIYRFKYENNCTLKVPVNGEYKIDDNNKITMANDGCLVLSGNNINCHYTLCPGNDKELTYLGSSEHCVVAKSGTSLYFLRHANAALKVYIFDMGEEIKNFIAGSVSVDYNNTTYTLTCCNGSKTVLKYEINVLEQKSVKNPLKTEYSTLYATKFAHCDNGWLSYRASINNNTYKQYYQTPSFDTFYGYLKKGEALLDTTIFDSDVDAKWDSYYETMLEYRINEWYIKNNGYHIGINASDFKEVNDNLLSANHIFYVKDGDGCPLDSVIYDTVNVMPGPKIRTELSTNPTKANPTGGTAKLSYEPGGTVIYKYGGNELNKKTTVEVKGLHWGDNVVEFTPSDPSYPIIQYTVTLVPNVSISTVAQSCSLANGKIIISGTDYELLDSIRYYGTTVTANSVSPMAISSEITGLSAGSYNVDVKIDEYWCEMGTCTVENKIFSVTAEVSEDIVPIGTTSKKVTFTANNFSTGTISFNCCLSESMTSSTKDYSLEQGTYDITASYNGCNSIIDKFNIALPTASLTSAQVVQDANADTMSIKAQVRVANIDTTYTISLKNGDNILRKSKAIDTTGVKYESKSKFELLLNYSIGDSAQPPITLASFSPQTIECSAVGDSNVKRCVGDEGVITLKTNVDCEYSINSGGFENISSSKEVKENKPVGNHKVLFRKEIEEPKNSTYGVIKFTYYKTFDVSVEPVDTLKFFIESEDVSCKGFNDGVMRLNPDSIKNNRGAVYFCIDYGDNYSDCYDDVSNGLKAGEYNIKVIDKGCLPSNYTTEDIKKSPYGVTREIEEPEESLSIIKAVPYDPTCRNNDGQITVQAKGGWSESLEGLTGCYNVSLQQQSEFDEDKPLYNPKTDITFDGLGFGDYVISVTDYNNCTVTEDVSLDKYQNPYVTKALFDSVTCSGFSDGKIKEIKFKTDPKVKSTDTLSLYYSKVDTLPDTVGWQGFSFVIPDLSASYYHIWLKDKNECVSDTNKVFAIEVKEPDPLKLSFPSQNTIIPEYGKPGGNVEVYVTGGNKGRFGIFLHDSIMPDSIGNAVDSIPILLEKFYPGLHILSVKDHKGCADTTTTGKFIQPDAPLTFTATTKIGLCNGAPDSVKIVPSGGWGRYHYTNLLAKDTVEAVNVKTDTVGLDSAMHIFLLSAGTYKVSVIDAAGVVYSEYVTIESQDSLVALPVTKPATCKNDGYIGVDIKGGSAPYKVFAYDFGFNDTLKTEADTYKKMFGKSFPAGAYTVATVDKNNCRVLTNVEVRDTNVTVSVIKEFPGLRQYAGGSLEAIASRGVNPYTYLWTNMYTGETSTEKKWSGLYAGVYQIEVKDDVGCDVQKIVKLPTNGDMPLKIDTVTNETGVGKNDGTARFTSDTTGFVRMVLFSNRNDSIIYDAVPSGMQFELTKLAPGSYVLECRLPKGESRYAEFSIAKYELINLLVTNIMKVTRPGYDDGSANVHIDGGEGPFNIQILKGDYFYADTLLANSRVLAMEQLEAGTYYIRVEDRYGKRSDVTAIIAEPEKMLALKLTSAINPDCYGETNGEVAVEAEGGWGNYEYAEIDSAFSRLSTYTSRKAETYTFVVKDEAGVTDTLSVTLSQPDSLRASLVSVDSVSCFGRFDGSATFSIKGGVAPYTIKLDSLFPYKDTVIGSLNAGYHRFWFVDDHFCNSHDSIVAFIPQPERLQITGAQVVHTTCDADNGSISISVSGGTQPYSYSWLEDGHSKSKFNGLGSSADGLVQLALYNVKVTDANNCATEKSYRMNDSNNPKISYVSTMPVLCAGDANGTAMLDSSSITAAVPYAPFRIEWPHGQNQMMVNDLKAGRYEVWIIDTNNCKGAASFEIASQSPVELHKLGSRDASCFGYSDGAINVMTYGGVGNFTYLWNTGHTLSKLDSIPKGTYTVIVADKNNCRDSATYSISQPDSIHVEIGEDTVLMCPENEYPLAASKNFASYKWYLDDSLMFDTRKVSVSDGGEYHLVATYGANCIARDTVTVIIGDDLLKADFYMASDASIDTTIALVELSNMKVDSLRWDFSQDDFEVIDETAYEIYLKPYNLGIHPVTLWAYSSGCVSYITKEVEIVELAENSDSISLGYNPMIRSITVVPNPTSGKFTVDLDLREVDDVSLSIAESGSGTVVETRNLTGKAKYEETFDISNHVGGTFLINVQSGSDRRTAKIMLVK